MSASSAIAPSTIMLKARIGWICQTLRLAALGYLVWIFVLIARFWGEDGRAARIQGAWLKTDLSEITGFQRLAGFSVSFTLWCIVAFAVFCLWRLCGNYLAGRIFTTDAAALLKKISILGLVTQIADMFARPVISAIVTLHLPEAKRQFAFSTNPNDLLVMLFLTALFALAHIFHVAAEIADDQAQII